jgi:GNAT superfamily N-acetyltransferase
VLQRIWISPREYGARIVQRTVPASFTTVNAPSGELFVRGDEMARSPVMTLTVRPLTPGRWKDVEALFGPGGASAGCWCMYWRLGRDDRYGELKGAPLKRRFRALVQAGEVHAVLAYDGKTPVGWLTYGPRPSFPRLERAKGLACADPERVWSLPCFFVRRGYRRRGISRLLLAAALERMEVLGVELAEGYPVTPSHPGERLRIWLAYTGTRPIFDDAGFALQPSPGDASRQRVRRRLKPAARRRG